MNSFLRLSELAQLLVDLAEELDVSPSKYEEAERHYFAVGEWLNAGDSDLRKFEPTIYPQGSFGLGTAVKPLGGGDYDVDAVCLLERPPVGVNQLQLKKMVGDRLKAHGVYEQLLQPEGRRCWTLKYADSSRFHLDVLPAIPRQPGPGDAIRITDTKEPSTFWGDSDPKGYQQWFKDRMKVVFARELADAAIAKAASVEEIPDYEVRTPLQRLIQILKRHRDLHYGGDEDKPISIIITTLAARAYDNEPDLHQALTKVIPLMRSFIVEKDGIVWIPNPVIPTENFADKWREHPRKQFVFREWLNQVEAFGRELTSASSESDLQNLLDRQFGRELSSVALAKIASRRSQISKVAQPSAQNSQVLSKVVLPRFLSWASPYNPPHRKNPYWIADQVRGLQLQAWVSGGPGGANGRRLLRHGESIPKGCSLHFEVVDTPAAQETIYWQVVNTGREAEDAKQLRGGMEKSRDTSRTESSLYKGKHWVECFFVRPNEGGTLQCTGRSGEFVVNID